MCSCRGGGQGGHNLHVSVQWAAGAGGLPSQGDGGDRGIAPAHASPEVAQGMWGSPAPLWGTEVETGENKTARAGAPPQLLPGWARSCPPTPPIFP